MREAASPEAHAKMLRGQALTAEEVAEVVQRVSEMNDVDFKILSAQTAMLNLNLLNKSIAATEQFASSSTTLTKQVISAIESFDRSSGALTKLLVVFTVLLVALTLSLIRLEHQAFAEQTRILEDSRRALKEQVGVVGATLDAQKRMLGEISALNQVARSQANYTKQVQAQVQDISKPRPHLDLQVERKQDGATAIFKLGIVNFGQAAAKSVLVRVIAHTSDLKLRCDCPYSQAPTRERSPTKSFVLRLGEIQGGDIERAVVALETGRIDQSFTVDFTVEAENFPRSSPEIYELYPVKNN